MKQYLLAAFVAAGLVACSKQPPYAQPLPG